MLMQPNQADVRKFFCAVYHKIQTQQPLQPIEQMAAYWVTEHPEYWAELANLELALANMRQITPEQENPFLHLAMHLTISEQYAIDQPVGIRSAIDKLTAKLNSLHLAHHEVMPALANMLWRSQQDGVMPDGEQYIAEIMQILTARR